MSPYLEQILVSSSEVEAGHIISCFYPLLVLDVRLRINRINTHAIRRTEVLAEVAHEERPEVLPSISKHGKTPCGAAIMSLFGGENVFLVGNN